MQNHIQLLKRINLYAIISISEIEMCIEIEDVSMGITMCIFGPHLYAVLFLEEIMDTRIAIIGIIVEDIDSTGRINDILHDYSMYVIGRMGIPYREKDINIISIALDAPADVINTLAGKIGKVPGVSAKTMYSRVPGTDV